MSRVLALTTCLLVAQAARSVAADAPPSQSLHERGLQWLREARITAPPESLKLPPFYRKYVDVLGLPVLSSEKAHDAALLEIGYLTFMMLGNRPDICHAMARNKTRLVVIAHNEFTTDTPEFADMEPKDWWDRRARGMGAQPHRPVMTCGEENLIALEGDPYRTESIYVHEFAHAIMDMGLVFMDPDFTKRITAAYEDAKAKGLWKGKYPMTSINEYWAEAVQSYFGTNREPDHDHNHVNTRAELAEYDPGIFKLVDATFAPNDWQYTFPKDRANLPHLANLDRSKLPKFEWPVRLAEAARKLDEQKRQKLIEAGEIAAPKPR